MGGCQTYGPFLGSLRNPKRDHKLDSHPYTVDLDGALGYTCSSRRPGSRTWPPRALRLSFALHRGLVGECLVLLFMGPCP